MNNDFRPFSIGTHIIYPAIKIILLLVVFHYVKDFALSFAQDETQHLSEQLQMFMNNNLNM